MHWDHGTHLRAPPHYVSFAYEEVEAKGASMRSRCLPSFASIGVADSAPFRTKASAANTKGDDGMASYPSPSYQRRKLRKIVQALKMDC
ncbi:hypothetical protein BHE74_00057373 [Ensete ventricosum]|nr:hypothetical protein BHE74_00057373 [Ensete ventricosum]RZS15558.1 hypothetical protein BHM03_00047403 [Ensete ventricosum]